MKLFTDRDLHLKKKKAEKMEFFIRKAFEFHFLVNAPLYFHAKMEIISHYGVNTHFKMLNGM